MQIFTHYFFTLWISIFIAFIFFRKNGKVFNFIATMLIDLDHLLVEPIFETNRCSINFHLLHVLRYVDLSSLLFFRKPFRIIGIWSFSYVNWFYWLLIYVFSLWRIAGSPAIELLKATSRLIEFEYLNSSGEN
jgi:hypothetical protein